MAISSFLDKLKAANVNDIPKKEISEAPKAEDKMPLGAVQLDVDVYQTPYEIVVFAPVSGTKIEDLDISVEGDNDVVTIQGTSKRPELLKRIQITEEGAAPPPPPPVAPAASQPIPAPGQKPAEAPNPNVMVLIEGAAVQGATEKFLRSECHWGTFYRQIVLPAEVRVSEAQAKLEKGVLVLRLPLVAPKTGDRVKLKIIG